MMVDKLLHCSTSPIIKWAFYRSKRNKRIAMKFVGANSCTHIHGARRDGVVTEPHIVLNSDVEKCFCHLQCVLQREFFGEDCTYTIGRVKKGRRLTVNEMYMELFVMVQSEWMKDGSRVFRFSSDKLTQRVENQMRSIECPNQIDIPTFFPVPGHSSSSTLKIPLHIINPLKYYDFSYLLGIYPWLTIGDMHKNVWHEVKEKENVVMPGTEWDDSKYPEKFAGPRKDSLFNSALGGNDLGPYANYTMEDLPRKQPIRYEKFKKETHQMNKFGKQIAPMIPDAMAMMYKAMKLEKYKNCQTFVFDEEEINEMVIPLDTSPGIRAGPTVTREYLGINVTFTVNGVKFLQQQRAREELLNMIRDFGDGVKTTMCERAWTITFKPEVLFGKTLEEQRKFRDKVRIYFIPTTEYYLLSRLVQGYRQKVERGDVIRIGMSWWHGGAYEFAKYFRYDDPDMIWGQGDFSGLDTSIKFHLLMLYSYSAKYYYNNGGDSELFNYLLGEAAINLSAKVTHVYGNIWRYMFGVMPSGAYETSHGDSWIVTLLYFLYFLMATVKHPDRAGEIMDYVEAYYIVISVYGDDSALAVPKKLRDVINIHGFAKFCKTYFDMTMRDLEEYNQFLSVPDQITGEFKREGVVFLQRAFIDSKYVDTCGVDVPPVLPYRGLKKIVQKSVFGSGDLKHPVEHLVSFIGMAYDTQGTNELAYNYCLFMYANILQMLGGTFDELIAGYDFMGNRSCVKLMRKMQLTKEQILEGFPTRKRIMEMHIYDENKLVSQPDYTPYGSGYLVGED